MPEDFRIKSFLVAHMEEIKGMLDTEYNEAEVNEAFKKKAEKKEIHKRLEKCFAEERPWKK